MSEIAIVLCLTIIIPLIVVLHFITKWKQSREISGDDEKMLEDMYEMSQRMEERIRALETILEDELPDWRKKI